MEILALLQCWLHSWHKTWRKRFLPHSRVVVRNCGSPLHESNADAWSWDGGHTGLRLDIEIEVWNPTPAKSGGCFIRIILVVIKFRILTLINFGKAAWFVILWSCKNVDDLGEGCHLGHFVVGLRVLHVQLSVSV